MKKRSILRSAAHWDIIAQAEYFGQESGASLANRFFDAVEATCRLLQKQPAIGKPSRIPELQAEGVREFPLKGFGKYVVFYRSVPEGIEILRVLHGSRDIDTVLKN